MKETRYPVDIIYSVRLKSGQTVENQFISCYGHSDDVIEKEAKSVYGDDFFRLERRSIKILRRL